MMRVKQIDGVNMKRKHVSLLGIIISSFVLSSCGLEKPDLGSVNSQGGEGDELIDTPKAVRTADLINTDAPPPPAPAVQGIVPPPVDVAPPLPAVFSSGSGSRGGFDISESDSDEDWGHHKPNKP